MALIAMILLVGSFLLGALALLLALSQWRRAQSDAQEWGRDIGWFLLIVLTVVGMGCAAFAYFVCETGQVFALAALTIHALCFAIGLGGRWREWRGRRYF
jgi:drug/metabolite transporter (DMT)-like permease